jgi:hypothetical protein
MNYVVVPLSRIGPRPTPPTPVWTTGVLVHMFLIGTPIVLAARRAFTPNWVHAHAHAPASVPPASEIRSTRRVAFHLRRHLAHQLESGGPQQCGAMG